MTVGRPGVARRKGEKDGVGPGGLAVEHHAAQVFAIGVDGIDTAGFTDGDHKGVGMADAADAGTGTSAVETSVVVVPELDDDPVARAQTLAHRGPELAVEGAAAGTAEGVVLHGYLVFVAEVVLKIAPAPLAVVAVAFGARTHGGIAHEEEHGVAAASRAARHGAHGVGLFEAVEGEVHHMIDVLHGTETAIVLSKGQRACRTGGSQKEMSFHCRKRG